MKQYQRHCLHVVNHQTHVNWEDVYRMYMYYHHIRYYFVDMFCLFCYFDDLRVIEDIFICILPVPSASHLMCACIVTMYGYACCILSVHVYNNS